MKNIIISLFIGLLLLLRSCNENEFLDRYPKDSPSPGSFFVDASTARQAVNACYTYWKWADASGDFSGGNMLWRDMIIQLDAMTDDSFWRQARGTSIQLEKWDINPTHTNVVDWWRYPYASINAANFAIENIPNSADPGFTPELQKPYIAEAKFFRAYGYLWLTAFYGDVPLILSPTSDFSEYYQPVTPKADVLAQVVKDFADAVEGLPPTQSARDYPVKATAGAYLAKAYLVMGEWAKAESAARAAVQSAEGNGFGLMDDYLSIWSDEGNKELLFFWGFNDNVPYGNNMAVERLSRDLEPTLRNAINGDGWGYCLPQRDLYDEFEPDDPRRGYTMYAPGDDYNIYPGPDDFTYEYREVNAPGDTLKSTVTYHPGDMVKYDYRWAPTGLNVRKMTRPVLGLANVQFSGLDIPAMRMAELYLLLAEALAEQGNGEALQWVNKVRQRASVNIPGRTLGDGRKGDNSLVDIVRHERRVELAMEGDRLFDLIRWGTLGEVFGNGTKVKRHFYSDLLPAGELLKYDSPDLTNVNRNPVFPIPQDEIDHNPNINENNGDWK
jgi:hypothetical protein